MIPNRPTPADRSGGLKPAEALRQQARDLLCEGRHLLLAGAPVALMLRFAMEIAESLSALVSHRIAIHWIGPDEDMIKAINQLVASLPLAQAMSAPPPDAPLKLLVVSVGQRIDREAWRLLGRVLGSFPGLNLRLVISADSDPAEALSALGHQAAGLLERIVLGEPKPLTDILARSDAENRRTSPPQVASVSTVAPTPVADDVRPEPVGIASVSPLRARETLGDRVRAVVSLALPVLAEGATTLRQALQGKRWLKLFATHGALACAALLAVSIAFPRQGSVLLTAFGARTPDRPALANAQVDPSLRIEPASFSPAIEPQPQLQTSTALPTDPAVLLDAVPAPPATAATPARSATAATPATSVTPAAASASPANRPSASVNLALARLNFQDGHPPIEASHALPARPAGATPLAPLAATRRRERPDYNAPWMTHTMSNEKTIDTSHVVRTQHEHEVSFSDRTGKASQASHVQAPPEDKQAPARIAQNAPAELKAEGEHRAKAPDQVAPIQAAAPSLATPSDTAQLHASEQRVSDSEKRVYATEQGPTPPLTNAQDSLPPEPNHVFAPTAPGEHIVLAAADLPNEYVPAAALAQTDARVEPVPLATLVLSPEPEPEPMPAPSSLIVAADSAAPAEPLPLDVHVDIGLAPAATPDAQTLVADISDLPPIAADIEPVRAASTASTLRVSLSSAAIGRLQDEEARVGALRGQIDDLEKRLRGQRH